MSEKQKREPLYGPQFTIDGETFQFTTEALHELYTEVFNVLRVHSKQQFKRIEMMVDALGGDPAIMQSRKDLATETLTADDQVLVAGIVRAFHTYQVGTKS